MRNELVKYALLALVVAALACNQIGISGQSPVAPGSTLRVTMNFATTSSHTIRNVKLTFDGREIASAAPAGGSGEVTFDVAVSGVNRGAHTIGFLVVDQASSPNPYFASGSVSLPEKILDLARVEKLLATGETLEVHISI